MMLDCASRGQQRNGDDTGSLQVRSEHGQRSGPLCRETCSCTDSQAGPREARQATGDCGGNSSLLWTARVQEAEQRPLRCSMLALIEPGTEAASPFNDPLLQNRRVSEYLCNRRGSEALSDAHDPLAHKLLRPSCAHTPGAFVLWLATTQVVSVAGTNL